MGFSSLQLRKCDKLVKCREKKNILLEIFFPFQKNGGYVALCLYDVPQFNFKKISRIITLAKK